ncbi:hypothetical protein OBO34_21700 [Clostridiales Family XIII bacterium ASD5510]|uniref:RNA polymerase sigma-70 region 4 domain-containing protein n=1 Tax=Hominibacterium faecale TaxID=2839743 RepID=A0A9J6QZS7_9FIRM|nr:sigma factor-like helix-turn-helix DNA-binding protein [Hominibacterium faecale]MCU7380933.1 hypothetical protein [Hominibacterium faecale]
MTKERLEQLKYIERSLKSVQDDIKHLNRQIASSTGRTFTDVTKGSMPAHPYIERHYEIQGIDMSHYDRLCIKLREKEAELQKKLLELENWLEGIEDEKLYLIFRLRYRDGMTTKQIGDELGYTQSAISRKINDYMRNG